MARYMRKRFRKQIRRRPYGRKRSFRRGRGKKNYSKTKIRTLISSDRTFVKLRWATTKHVTTSTDGTTITHSYAANSLLQPDGTGTPDTHQPTGSDEWKAFYSKYVVMGSSCKIEVCNNRAFDLANVVLEPSQTTSVTSAHPEEIAYTSSRLLGNSDTNKSWTTLKRYMKTSRMYGKKVMQEDDFATTVSFDPINLWYWNLKMVPVAGSDQGTTPTPAVLLDLTYRIVITYYVCFFERKQNILLS